MVYGVLHGWYNQPVPAIRKSYLNYIEHNSPAISMLSRLEFLLFAAVTINIVDDNSIGGSKRK